MSMTFSQWLSHSADAEFESFVRTRRDLLQPESPTMAALAAAASSRIGVSRGIEALDAGTLEVFIALAKAARTTPEIEVAGIAHIDPALAEAAVPRLRDLGLAWPAGGDGGGAGSAGSAESAGSAGSAVAGVWKIQSEAITLLPTSAAESSRAHPWQIDESSIDSSTATIGQPLIHNSEQAAVAEVISSLRGLVDELAASPISRLTSGGISKRDVSRLARTLELGLEQTITLLQAAKSLHLIGVLDDALDPQWTAADDADSALAGDRADLWAGLVGAWLRDLLDVTQLAAGASENERLTVLAAPKKSLFKGYGLSVPAMPLLRFAVLSVLHDIGLGTARSAGWIHAEVLRRHPLLPAHEFAMTEAVLHTCVTVGLATTPLQQPDHFGPSRFGLRLAAGLDRAMAEHAVQDPSILPLGVSVEALTVPGDVIAAVTEGLGAEVDTVLIQSDLTAVATGPIEPRVHNILRKYAVVEARGQGTVYRIDAETIEDTMQAGLTPEEALAELAEISAEELPSTLEFLVQNTASKLRRVRVAGARSVLIVDDPVDLDVILSDQAMMPAGLERLAPTVAIAQLGPERTMHLLEASDHHALLHSAAGPVRKRRVITESEPEVSVRRRPRVSDGHLGEYIRILRSAPATAAPVSTDEPLGHMDRLREAAETKQRVLIRIADSHGKERTIEMLPATLNAGRVRGVVTTTGAEASLSVARIVSVTPSP
ncbi:helicase-associated domain-containing protein [Brevibacterium linens]|uniref:Helicase conserved C-terminal domain-containing protein n=1 Tax=Brevibacterium linens TaxID=1703 RepID=A0A2H1IUL1_BRELN|nr:helicase-associated domain-containing protein [Brevibacterium linens]SMX78854.1 Helicase conserved C-terminal domain-containing protein [Brevibacterium linens]